MKPCPAILFLCALLGCVTTAPAQTKIKLSMVLPGTENVQLVYNGDFQFQGALVGNAHPSPAGWATQADIFADPGTNMVGTDSGVVARGLVNNGASVSMFSRTVKLEPNTAYVLSAYLWNMGDFANRVNTDVDLNDAPQDPQLTLTWADANADQGYFLYRSFNTSTTGSNVTLRVFYDGFTGTGASATYFPVAAQRDNIAITKAANFLAPQASGNLRPMVSMTNVSDGAYLFPGVTPATLTVAASASDGDGTITKVEFYADTSKLGETASRPYALTWTNVTSGSYQLTAVATDNGGATKVSAPVNIYVLVPPPPPTLAIAQVGTNLSVSWPASATAFSLLGASNLAPGTLWRPLTNAAIISSNRNIVATANAGPLGLFRLGTVDTSTADRKLLMGYQGWFGCAGDGSPGNNWVHWFRNNAAYATNATVDFWPDTSEMDADELLPTKLTLTDGSPAKLYSAYNQKTVLRHFKWMKDNNLDGVFLQRFSSSLSSASSRAFRNQVTVNVRAGAEAYGRAFALMYDISGTASNTLVSTLTNDWTYPRPGRDTCRCGCGCTESARSSRQNRWHRPRATIRGPER